MFREIHVTAIPVFTEYHNILEEYLQEYSDKFLKEELKKYPDNLDPYVENMIYSQYFYLAESLPNILRTSFIVTCYSYLEHELIQKCKIEKNAKPLQLSINDLNGKGIEQAKNYLIKVVGIDFPIGEPWNEIMNIKDIRNFIVHKRGILDNSKKAEKIRTYIDKRQDISLELDEIILSADYCRYVINIFDKFLSNLSNAL